MPLFATLVASCISGLTTFYAAVLSLEQALVWARRTFIIALGASFATAVKVCVNSLLAMVATSTVPARFAMGLGMFIPSNAAAVLACVGSVWLACIIYRMKLEGLRW